MKTRLEIDTINGIRKVKEFEDTTKELIKEEILLSAIKDMSEKDIIYSEVSELMLKKLDYIYGVH